MENFLSKENVLTLMKYSDNIMIILSEELKILEYNNFQEIFTAYDKKNIKNENIWEILKKSTNIEEMIGKNIEDLNLLLSFNEKELTFKKDLTNKLKFYIDKLPNYENEKIAYLLVLKNDKNIKKIKDYYENIISLLPEHVYWQNKNCVYLGCNDKQAKSAGLNSRHEIVGKKNKDLPWNYNAGVLPEELDKINIEVMKTGIPITIEEPAILNDGSELTFLSRKEPLKNENGEIFGILGISFDITELKTTQKKLYESMEKLKLSNKFNSYFLSIAAHEIRGPISNVILLLDSFKNTIDKNDNHPELLNKSLSEAERAISSMDNLLKLLSLDTNTFNHNMAPCNLKNFAEETFQSIKSEYSEIPISLEYKINESIHKEIKFDTYHVREILEILIKNSIKYSKNKPEILLDISESDNEIIFSIKDKGIGISEDQLKKLLIPFFDPADLERTSQKFSKPSIKLSYIKKMLSIMGGEIKVKSKLNAGSEFCFTVPFKQINHKSDNLNSINIQNIKNISKLHILVVEDDPVTLQLHKKYILNLGHHVDTASNGKNAVKLATKNNYDIIFLDITLPDISGIDVLNKIRDIKQDMSFFVAVTSHSSDEDISFFNKQEFSTVLIKPVTEVDFEGCIETIQKIRSEKN